MIRIAKANFVQADTRGDIKKNTGIKSVTFFRLDQSQVLYI